MISVKHHSKLISAIHKSAVVNNRQVIALPRLSVSSTAEAVARRQLLTTSTVTTNKPNQLFSSLPPLTWWRIHDCHSISETTLPQSFWTSGVTRRLLGLQYLQGFPRPLRQQAATVFSFKHWPCSCSSFSLLRSNVDKSAINQNKPKTRIMAQQDNRKWNDFPKPNVVFVLGAPGSGKGTQCSNLVKVSCSNF